jgi:hypothetical protein
LKPRIGAEVDGQEVEEEVRSVSVASEISLPRVIGATFS